MFNRAAYNAFMIPFEKFAGLAKCRKELISLACGNVLEAGPGTGANAKYYNMDKIDRLTLIAPEPDKHELSKKVYAEFNLEYIEADVQKLPFNDNYFDTVVATLLFCSVKNPASGLAELRRVLKPGGRYLFIEHIKPETLFAAGIAAGFTPVWKKIAGGCRLDSNTRELILKSGFKITAPCIYSKGVFISGCAE